MERNAILKLAESYDSFYLYEEAVILRNINRLKADFPGVSFLYSAKCNPYPKVLECVLAQGFGIDAASAAECVMGQRAGLDPNQILYSAPGKTLADIKAALPIATVIADSAGEVGRIQQAAAELGITADIGLRVNPDFSYGTDSGTSLVELIEKAAEVEGIERIRLGSLDPDMLHDEVITRMAAVKKLCPQFHLSLQSGCDKTLRAMRRPYTTAQFADIAAKLRAAFGAENVSFTTDVIVGFPGETEEDFEASMAFVTGQRFLKVHVFPYSRREGTPAYDFPGQLPEHEKEDRSRRMTAAVEKVRAAEVAAMQGRTASVLLETPLSATLFTGYTKQYLPVLVSAPGHRTGDIVNVMLGAWDGRRCRAEIVGK